MRLEKGQMIWVNLQGGIGREQQGVSRPCIIVQNNMGNKYSETTIVVPLTRRIPKRRLPTHLRIDGRVLGRNFVNSTVLTEQIKVIDSQRIISVQHKLPDSVMHEIDQKILVSLGIHRTVS